MLGRRLHAVPSNSNLARIGAGKAVQWEFTPVAVEAARQPKAAIQHKATNESRSFIAMIANCSASVGIEEIRISPLSRTPCVDG